VWVARSRLSTPIEVDAPRAYPVGRVRRQVKGNLMKKQKFKYSEQQALDTCIRQLEGLLEGLKSGTLSLSQGDEKLWLRPGGAVDVELRAEQSGDHESLEIKLAWQRSSLSMIPRRPDDAPPKTVRGWQMNGLDESDMVSGVPQAPDDLDADSVARAS
jgi:amphi-Trp domain-containing protein